jgi:flavin reductase (DIM6/NTAB) family NADH-FMN oxidoreductase RutF
MTHRALDPQILGPRASYQLLNVCVSPRPIAFVSTLSPEGLPNLAPFSYFMAGGANPPSIVISPVGSRTGAKKDTLVNIEATGEWTVSVVTHAMAERMSAASAGFPYGVSEWAEAGFVPAPSELVEPGFVAESPLALECKLFQLVRHGPGPLSANYCIGEIVRFHVAEELLGDDGSVDATRIDYIARMSADWYARANADAMFILARPE